MTRSFKIYDNYDRRKKRNKYKKYLNKRRRLILNGSQKDIITNNIYAYNGKLNDKLIPENMKLPVKFVH